MTTHYTGRLSRLPMNRLHNYPAGDDLSVRWSQVDCSSCKVRLIGLRVADKTVPFADVLIWSVSARHLFIQIPPGGQDDPPFRWYPGGLVSFEQFDARWRLKIKD